MWSGVDVIRGFVTQCYIGHNHLYYARDGDCLVCYFLRLPPAAWYMKLALTAVAVVEPWGTTEHGWLSIPLSFSPLALQQESG